MAFSKIILNNTTLMDATTATAAAADITAPKTAMLADGVMTEGTGSGGGISVDDIATNTAPSGTVTLSSSVTSIEDYAFAGKPITSIVAPNVTSVGIYSFQGTSITELTNTNFPSLTTMSGSGYSFGGMTSLKRVYFTSASIPIGVNGYRGSNSLVVARFPNRTGGTGTSPFYQITNLEVLDLGSTSSTGSSFAQNSRKLQTIIIRKSDGICSLGGSALTGTPFAGYNGLSGIVYIPKTMYDHLGDNTSNDYQKATNWSSLYSGGYCTFAKLEGSPYEATDWDDSGFLT